MGYTIFIERKASRGVWFRHVTGKYEVYKYWAGGGTLREQYENTNSKACQEIFLTSALIIWLCTLSYHIDILHY